MRLRHLPPCVAAGVGLSAAAAAACPDCPTSRVVRQALLEVGFLDGLVMVCAPFLLIGFLSALLYRVGLPVSNGTRG